MFWFNYEFCLIRKIYGKALHNRSNFDGNSRVSCTLSPSPFTTHNVWSCRCFSYLNPNCCWWKILHLHHMNPLINIKKKQTYLDGKTIISWCFLWVFPYSNQKYKIETDTTTIHYSKYLIWPFAPLFLWVAGQILPPLHDLKTWDAGKLWRKQLENSVLSSVWKGVTACFQFTSYIYIHISAYWFICLCV